MSKKIEVLEYIATIFNKANVTWALGGSTLLFLKSITKDFDDIDIRIAEKDVSLVKELMSGISSSKQETKNPVFKTKAFLEYRIDGVDIDIMAGLLIVSDNKEYYLPLKDNKTCEVILINNTSIYLDSIESWLHYYQLMDRQDKVSLIKKTYK